jgi:hypothetical protein
MSGVPATRVRFILPALLVPSGLHAGSKLETRGKTVLQEKCARFHSVEAAGESPLSIACLL